VILSLYFNEAYIVPVAFSTGWAAAIRFNDNVRQQFDEFHSRSDTFSLGVCNGCQLMALLGWVAGCEGECPMLLLVPVIFMFFFTMPALTS